MPLPLLRLPLGHLLRLALPARLVLPALLRLGLRLGLGLRLLARPLLGVLARPLLRELARALLRLPPRPLLRLGRRPGRRRLVLRRPLGRVPLRLRRGLALLLRLLTRALLLLLARRRLCRLPLRHLVAAELVGLGDRLRLRLLLPLPLLLLLALALLVGAPRLLLAPPLVLLALQLAPQHALLPHQLRLAPQLLLQVLLRKRPHVRARHQPRRLDLALLGVAALVPRRPPRLGRRARGVDHQPLADAVRHLGRRHAELLHRARRLERQQLHVRRRHQPLVGAAARRGRAAQRDRPAVGGRDVLQDGDALAALQPELDVGLGLEARERLGVERHALLRVRQQHHHVGEPLAHALRAAAAAAALAARAVVALPLAAGVVLGLDVRRGHEPALARRADHLAPPLLLGVEEAVQPLALADRHLVDLLGGKRGARDHDGRHLEVRRRHEPGPRVLDARVLHHRRPAVEGVLGLRVEQPHHLARRRAQLRLVLRLKVGAQDRGRGAARHLWERLDVRLGHEAALVALEHEAPALGDRRAHHEQHVVPRAHRELAWHLGMKVGEDAGRNRLAARHRPVLAVRRRATAERAKRLQLRLTRTLACEFKFAEQWVQTSGACRAAPAAQFRTGGSVVQ